MILMQIIILALVQGLTEFLPISSSGHLILVPELTDWPVQSIAFDVAVHVGTLVAVLIYFYKDVRTLTLDWTSSVIKRENVGESRLAWIIIIASIPVAIFGWLLHDFISNGMRNGLVIGITTLGFGLLLGVADWKRTEKRDIHSLKIRDGLIVGFVQSLALIPGTSRSGITMTFALFLGLTRSAAARFSFLLAIPAIVMAGGYESLKLAGDAKLELNDFLIGSSLSFIVAILCIHFFMKLIDRVGMWPFVLYRVILGAALLYVFI